MIPDGTLGNVNIGRAVGEFDFFTRELIPLLEFVPPADADKTPVVVPNGLLVQDPFDADEIADLVVKHGKVKAMEAILQRKEILRISKALSDGKVAAQVPEKSVKLATPAKELPYFLQEIWHQIKFYWDDNAPAVDITFEEEIISSSVHHQISEETYQALSEQYKRVNANIATTRDEMKKTDTVPLKIRLGLLEQEQQEVIKMLNAKSNSKTLPMGMYEFKLPSKTISVKCKLIHLPTMRGLLRQWRLSTNGELDLSEKLVEVKFPSFVDDICWNLVKSTVRSKAIDLSVSILDLATATQSSLNDLTTKCKQVFPEVTIKNPFVFTEWPEEIQKIIQTGKNASKGVQKAITWCVEHIKSLTATKFDKAFAAAVLKCPASDMTVILGKYGAANEVGLPNRVKLAIVWCSKQNRPEEEFSNLREGKIVLDMFIDAEKDLLKQSAPKESKVTLAGLLDKKGKKEKSEKKQGLKGLFTDSMTTAWIEAYGTLAQPAWVAKAAVINEAFVLFLIRNHLCGSGTSGIPNNKDFKDYKPTTLSEFAAKFYAWRQAGDFFSGDDNTKYSATQIREGQALSVYNIIKNIQEIIKDPTTGAESKRPVQVWDLTDLKNRVSRIPAEHKDTKSELAKGKKKSKKSKKSGPKTDTTPKTNEADKKQSSKGGAKPADDGNRRGRSRSRSVRPRDDDRKTASDVSKSRSRSRSKSGNKSSPKDAAGFQKPKNRRGPKKNSRGSTPKPTAKDAKNNSAGGRTVKLDGVEYAVGDIISSLPTDRSQNVAIGNNSFRASFLEKLLGNRAVKDLSSALDAKGKVKSGYSWDPVNKKFKRDSQSAPTSGRTSPVELKIKSSGRNRSKSPAPSKKGANGKK
jgi:hypothetical protein